MFEHEAEARLESLGLDTTRPYPPEHIARLMLGPENVERVHNLAVPARYRADRGVLEIAAKVSDAAAGWLSAHELAEIVLDEIGYREPDVEEVADRLAASFVAPRPALRRALRWLGVDIARLAKAFRTTQSIMALRLGEVTGRPLALVTPQRVHVRGEAFEWGTPGALRQLLTGSLPDGLERIAVTDAKGRHIIAAV